ncbi:hypothetical protein [Marinicellulosiphila megalodicopiae]|uniref:hypothetical protein n=1 Tax=Marinicellulosiphila megalodicopiae TaxID=2724896 RepID=UPI003BAEDFC1
MRCIYCKTPLITKGFKHENLITVPAKGVAHKRCAEQDYLSKRVFAGVELNQLSGNELLELKEIVLNEINERERGYNQEAAVELF